MNIEWDSSSNYNGKVQGPKVDFEFELKTTLHNVTIDAVAGVYQFRKTMGKKK